MCHGEHGHGRSRKAAPPATFEESRSPAAHTAPVQEATQSQRGGIPALARLPACVRVRRGGGGQVPHTPVRVWWLLCRHRELLRYRSERIGMAEEALKRIEVRMPAALPCALAA